MCHYISRLSRFMPLHAIMARVCVCVCDNLHTRVWLFPFVCVRRKDFICRHLLAAACVCDAVHAIIRGRITGLLHGSHTQTHRAPAF